MKRDLRILIDFDNYAPEDKCYHWDLIAFPCEGKVELSTEEWDHAITALNYVSNWARNNKAKQKEKDQLKIKEAIKELTATKVTA